MALSGLSERSELLHTSSAGPSDLVRRASARCGFISHSRTGMPRRASCTGALAARQPPRR